MGAERGGEPSTRRILAIVVPALGALAADPLLSLVDTAFVGRLGPVALAALGIDVAIFGFVFALFNFLAYATTPMVARARGRGDLRGSGEVVRQALGLAVLLGVVSSVVLVAAGPTLIGWFDPSSAVAAPATSYLRIRALALPALLVITAGHGAYRGFQDTRTPMVLTLIVNGINALLDPILMFGADLGLDGAAVATVVAQWAGAVAFLVLLGRRGTEEGWSRNRPRLAEAAPLLRVGGVLMVRTMLLVGSLAVATATASRISTEAVAAHQIVSQLWFLMAMIVDALAIAAQSMVAELAGGGDLGGARTLSRRLHRWGLGTGVVLGVTLWLAGGILVSIFSSDAAVRTEAATALAVAAAMQPLAALLFVSDGVYMAMVRMRRLAASTAAGFVTVVGGCIWTLSANAGLAGVWWSITGMVAMRSLVLALGYTRLFPGR